MKRILRFFTSYKFVLGLMFLLNMAVLLLIAVYFNMAYYGIVQLVALFTALCVMGFNKDEQVYKAMWLLVILILPLFGTVLYLQAKGIYFSNRQRKKWAKIDRDTQKELLQDPKLMDELETRRHANTAKYLFSIDGAPVYVNTKVKYYGDGQSYVADLIEAIKDAQKFVLLEYYIIKPGRVWEDVLEALKERAANGVKVKIIYDDFGCADKFKKKYFKKLAWFHIEAVPFNKLRLTFNQFVNYRDHRKIAVVDGKVGFTGGINLADEYCNIKSPFGIWEDCGLRLMGDAVWPITVAFFRNYERACNKNVNLAEYKCDFEKDFEGSGFVQPFCSGPINDGCVARGAMLKLINDAKKYLYITTPYFIVDETILGALKMAAQSGVDVKIIIPGIPDRKIISCLSFSYFGELLRAGVKVFEYTQGFVHGKMILSDDKIACVGTINFDFRSFFLHFENAVMLYDDPIIFDIKKNFERLENSSEELNPQHLKERKWFSRFVGRILRLFAPMM
ncbi:MAG: cardiolipin synthase [Christensenellaceae bacterium]|nr:cardiolipin synthase [Christensenellaceae bacterium]